jgi:hypothetical protein
MQQQLPITFLILQLLVTIVLIFLIISIVQLQPITFVVQLMLITFGDLILQLQLPPSQLSSFPHIAFE